MPSNVAGFLTPIDANPPLEDANLVALFQRLIVGLTGLDGTMVRPRWQVTLPSPPSNSTTWVSLGISHRRGDTNAFVKHDPTLNGGDGADVVSRQEELEILCSIYGPSADDTYSLIRDGLSVGQNLDTLRAAKVSLIEVEGARGASVLLNTLWYYRLDMPFRVRRLIERTYPVLTILAADLVVYPQNEIDTPSVPVTVSQ